MSSLNMGHSNYTVKLRDSPFNVCVSLWSMLASVCFGSLGRLPKFRLQYFRNAANIYQRNA